MFTGIIQSIGYIAAIELLGADRRVHIAAGKLDLDLERAAAPAHPYAHGTGVSCPAQVGDSIAVNGVCLTVTSFTDDGFWVDVSGETLARTTFGEMAIGRKVNLEQALTPATRLGGHLVSGHVDGIGTVTGRWEQGRSAQFVIQAPPMLAKYIAEKGSICVDGVSLTVNKVNGACAAHGRSLASCHCGTCASMRIGCASVARGPLQRILHSRHLPIHGRRTMPEATFDLNLVPHTLQETTLGELVAGSRVNLEVDILARYLERLLLGEGAALLQPPQSTGITHGFLVEHGFIKS